MIEVGEIEEALGNIQVLEGRLHEVVMLDKSRGLDLDIDSSEAKILQDHGYSSNSDLVGVSEKTLQNIGLPLPCARRIVHNLQAGNSKSPTAPPLSSVVNNIAKAVVRLADENVELKESVTTLKEELKENQLAFERNRLEWQNEVQKLRLRIEKIS
eukprot:TRINITY_DN18892_c0_g1_i1.p1 TRINITY_DN18892_c0_g1~~TRINITY_DN18892_c0_g1_i1.p1  ORF type:complete len:156 (+),score=25.63 TRINITY_DN18892_c0_g1_i1:115-582(+)